MHCEKCGDEIPAVVCRGCQETVAPLGPYCYRCGTLLTPPAEAEDETQQDFSKRLLCSDGNCIGVINEEGLCKVCGKPYVPDSSS
jgi:predicted amidophosphoribosyltransferase